MLLLDSLLPDIQAIEELRARQLKTPFKLEDSDYVRELVLRATGSPVQADKAQTRFMLDAMKGMT